MTTVAQAIVESTCLFPALPACQAHGSWDWEEFQAPRTPAEIQALPLSHKGNAEESPVFSQKPMLAKQFLENVSIWGPLNNGLGFFAVQRLWCL